jgi:hypothetical protein
MAMKISGFQCQSIGSIFPMNYGINGDVEEITDLGFYGVDRFEFSLQADNFEKSD